MGERPIPTVLVPLRRPQIKGVLLDGDGTTGSNPVISTTLEEQLRLKL